MTEKKKEPEYVSKAAHDKLRAEFNEFKIAVQRALGLDPNA